MRHFTYVEPTSATDMTPIFVTLSEEQIIAQYWDYWCANMQKIGFKRCELDHAHCIEDWCTIHWAVETTPC